MRGLGDILVVSCYELGRQPVGAANALGELRRAGFSPRAVDVAVEPLDPAAFARAKLVAISTPMHTALRLGVRVAEQARAARPDAHVCFFGLYAELNREHLLARHCDSVVGAEAAVPLRALAEALEDGRLDQPLRGVATQRFRAPAEKPSGKGAPVPSREGLPSLSRYAQLEGAGERRLVAAVEATRGCKHLCRHCPIVPVYRGRFVALPRETVLADIAQQIEAGARHVTFGDPDFLNGPTHALKLVRELHARWPEVSYDATIKIEHLLQHRALLRELRETGCLFITSAVESLSDRVLAELDKGHTAADVPVALRLVREAGIDLRPTLLPYTPWTSLTDLPALFDFAEDHDLLEQIDPVQYTIRLLIPPGSALLDGHSAADLPWLGPFDEAHFTWTWKHADPRMDELQRVSEGLAAAHAEAGIAPHTTLQELRALAEAAVGRAARKSGWPRPRRKVPRLTEPWFC